MQTFFRLTALSASLMILLLIQACAPTQVREEKPSFQQQVTNLVSQGEFNNAASLTETQARNSQSPQREKLLLDALALWNQARAWEESNRLLAELDPLALPPELEMRKRMLKAEVVIQRGDLDLAMDLMQPPPGPDSPLELRTLQHKNMAEIFRLTGSVFESARELVELDLLLAGSPARLDNQIKLVQTLGQMTDTGLTLLQPKPPGNLGGWMELVRIVKRWNKDPVNLDPQLKAWRERFPDHPAQAELLAHMLDEKITEQASHVAVLLPLSGSYVKAANALKDGLMAAWYQRPAENRPILRFYDSSNPNQILDLYRNAVAQGAQVVVGPLDKESVEKLLQAGPLERPILALNHVDLRQPPDPNLFFYGLSPRDEAEQVAEWAWLEGHTRAIALTPRDDWGNRIYAGFRERWQALGGKLLEHQTYDPKGNDFSSPIKQLLNLDESEARERDLQNIIGATVETEPRRRDDAQFLFLAARTQKARQIGPQLRFFHVGGLPIYATSHIYDGVDNKDADADIGEMKFVDTPWLLDEQDPSELSRKNLETLIPGAKSNYARLYAMGMDAFDLLPLLTQMRDQPSRQLNGKSGNLYMDGSNQIHRQLAWAEMKDGLAHLIGYAPLMERTGSPNPPIKPVGSSLTPQPASGATNPPPR